MISSLVVIGKCSAEVFHNLFLRQNYWFLWSASAAQRKASNYINPTLEFHYPTLRIAFFVRLFVGYKFQYHSARNTSWATPRTCWRGKLPSRSWDSPCSSFPCSPSLPSLGSDPGCLRYDLTNVVVITTAAIAYCRWWVHTPTLSPPSPQPSSSSSSGSGTQSPQLPRFNIFFN